jgi:hypothetical protein
VWLALQQVLLPGAHAALVLGVFVVVAEEV